MAQPVITYEGLPTEIHYIILSHASSLEDVYATIRASPATLHGFLSRRERILIKVLESSVAPQVFRLMISIINVPKVVGRYRNFQYQPSPEDAVVSANLSGVIYEEQVVEKIKKRCAWVRHIKRLNEDCFRTCSDAHPVPGSRPFDPDNPEQEAQEFKTQVQALMKLNATVNRYVSAFQVSSLSTAQGRMPLFLPKDTIGLERISASEEWPALNSTEKHRLQRAFLHYELGCCLMRALSRLPTVETPPQSESIESRFSRAGIDLSPPNPFWEFNRFSRNKTWEMDMVESFIVSMYEMIYGRLCLDLFGSFRAVAREAPTGRSAVKVKTVREWLKGTSHEPSDVPGARLASWDPKEFIRKISHLGLSYLETVLRSKMNDQRELFQIGVNLTKHDYLGRLYDHDYLSKLPLGCHSSKEATPHFAAYCEGWKHNMFMPSLRGKALTRVGWVFYDEERRCQTLRLPTVADVSKTNQNGPWSPWERFMHSYEGTCHRWNISKATWDSVPELDLYVTEEDFRNIVFSNYFLLQPDNGPRNHLDTFGYLGAAAQRFRAHVQSVVENTTVRLPSFGDIFPDGPIEVPSRQRRRDTRNPAGRRR